MENIQFLTGRHNSLSSHCTPPLSLYMGTGHSVNTNPSNNTKCARDIGCKISCSLSWSVILLVHCRLTEFPVIARVPLMGMFIRINCTKSSWKVFPTNDQWIHWVVLLLFEDIIISCMTLSSCVWSVIVTVLALKQFSPMSSLDTLEDTLRISLVAS